MAALLVGAGCASAVAPPGVDIDGQGTVESTSKPTTTTTRSTHPTRPRSGGLVVRELAGVTVGEPIDQAIAKVTDASNPMRENPVEKERGEWEELGYQPNQELPFLLGFDTAYTFDAPRVPIYMLFAKDGRVALIRASAYVSTTEEHRKVRIVDGCGLDSPSVCTELTFLDPALVQQQPSFGREVHHWLQHGVSMTVEAGAVRVIDVYGDLAPDVEARVADVLRKATPPDRPFYE